ncbi:hypothetical protein B0J17DRAFT_651471 [Rhizoctonia solani]|nr:hypothetical protein B0J17DRAFT_651471 [Rhizoctonia solani]
MPTPDILYHSSTLLLLYLVSASICLMKQHKASVTIDRAEPADVASTLSSTVTFSGFVYLIQLRTSKVIFDSE